MAVPKRKHSNSRSGKRRSHHQAKPKQTGFCAQCSTAVPTHVVCPNCGYYMGRVVDEPEDS
ncbi:MAG: 50S ribosomal protein L32 [Planctomycetales bacterium]|nr:50S ribosomal protein L32 [Planctomycetales bacterium]